MLRPVSGHSKEVENMQKEGLTPTPIRMPASKVSPTTAMTYALRTVFRMYWQERMRIWYMEAKQKDKIFHINQS